MRIFIEGGFYSGNNAPLKTDDLYKGKGAEIQWKERCEKALKIHKEIQATKRECSPTERAQYFWQQMGEIELILDSDLRMLRRHNMELEYPYPQSELEVLISQALVEMHPPQEQDQPRQGRDGPQLRPEDLAGMMQQTGNLDYPAMEETQPQQELTEGDLGEMQIQAQAMQYPTLDQDTLQNDEFITNTLETILNRVVTTENWRDEPGERHNLKCGHPLMDSILEDAMEENELEDNDEYGYYT